MVNTRPPITLLSESDTSSLFCATGCILTMYLSPVIPDIHAIVSSFSYSYGVGWKLPFGITFFNSEYTWHPDFYLICPGFSAGDAYKTFEDFNSVRLEFYPEIIISDSILGLMVGISGRLYIPITAYFSLHGESGVFINSELPVMYHVGGGLGAYMGSKSFLCYIQIAPRLFFMQDNTIVYDFPISIKIHIDIMEIF